MLETLFWLYQCPKNPRCSTNNCQCYILMLTQFSPNFFPSCNISSQLLLYYSSKSRSKSIKFVFFRERDRCPIKRPSIKDVRFFLVVFETPLPHDTDLPNFYLLISCNIGTKDPPPTLKIFQRPLWMTPKFNYRDKQFFLASKMFPIF